MGELTGNTPAMPNIDMGGTAPEGSGGYDTDVQGVKAPDVVKQGKDQFPCFDVTKEEFYQNMQDGRRRLRFKSGTDVQKYMSSTKYNRPFFVRHTDENGKKYVRKIK